MHAELKPIQTTTDCVVSKRQSADCPFVPLGERIILALIKENGMKGRLYIPDNAVDAPQFGIVVALGDLVVSDLELGDEVSFGKYTGNILKREDKEFLVLNLEDILAKVKRD